MKHDFYLASRSERRVQMLRQAGYRFASLPADVDEQAYVAESPADFARRMALEKSRAVSARDDVDKTLPVIGADTDVALDGQILGKPRDRDDAVNMLLRLSDRQHEVHSAVAITRGARRLIAATCTEVVFGRIARGEAESYWDSGEPADKAGAYAIQGLAGRWVREIRGSYSGVVGLPLFETMELLREFGVQPRWLP
ncbi:MAG: Maf family protein [Panacagrimonas sp.]